MSAYFTSSAYGALKRELDGAQSARFLFGEPRFLSDIEAETLVPPAFALTEDGLALAEQLRQRGTAKRCADWIRAREEVRSIAAALAHPGTPLRRPVGSAEPFTVEPKTLPKAPAKGRAKGRRPSAADRVRVKAPEAALAKIEAQRESEEARLRKEEEALLERRTEADDAYAKRRGVALAAVASAREALKRGR
ncbi:MAG: hypothetical protein ACRED8_10280 [Caulobacteraceae bacterium]